MPLPTDSYACATQPPPTQRETLTRLSGKKKKSTTKKLTCGMLGPPQVPPSGSPQRAPGHLPPPVWSWGTREGHPRASDAKTKRGSVLFSHDGEEMLGRVTKYRVNNDAPSEVFEAASEQERKVLTGYAVVWYCCVGLGRWTTLCCCLLLSCTRC